MIVATLAMAEARQATAGLGLGDKVRVAVINRAVGGLSDAGYIRWVFWQPRRRGR